MNTLIIQDTRYKILYFRHEAHISHYILFNFDSKLQILINKKNHTSLSQLVILVVERNNNTLQCSQ